MLIFKLTGDTAAHFTQGRSLTLLSVLRSGYKPAGIGTSYNVVHRIIEMDLIQFYLETTIIGLIIIVFAYIFPQERIVCFDFYGVPNVIMFDRIWNV